MWTIGPHLERSAPDDSQNQARDRKSTRLNSSHLVISYAVFCLKKKKTAHVSDSESTSGRPRLHTTMFSRVDAETRYLDFVAPPRSAQLERCDAPVAATVTTLVR